MVDHLVNGASLNVPMEPFHRLPLRFVHLKLSYRHFVLIAFTAWSHLIPDVNIWAASSPALLQKDLVVAHFELIRGKACLVIFEILLFAVVCAALATAVGALRRAVGVRMRPGQQNRRLVESGLRWLYDFLLLFWLLRLLRLRFLSGCGLVGIAWFCHIWFNISFNFN